MSTRRKFIKNTALAGTLIPVMEIPFFQIGKSDRSEKQSIHIFSKHLQFLDYHDVGAMAAEMGFDGVDLTVRPKGHVLPEKVKTDLPKAVKDIQSGGSTCQLITTSIENAKNVLDVDILNAASASKIKHYRTNWIKYDPKISMPESIKQCQQQIKKLSDLNEKLGLIGNYQNHAGRNIGSSFWEVDMILKGTNPQFFGTQYDVRHAMVEGGFSWENGFELLKHRIKTIVLKDYKWGQVNGKWEPVNVPVGEGIVDFNQYFKLLKSNNLNPPVSLHLEYDLGGAEKGESVIGVDKKVVFDAMKRDLSLIRKIWQEA
jgi:sugar phosphate isomerase/epimerase